MTRQAYIETYSQCVAAAVHGTTLFASVMMAQALLESADRYGAPGNSYLARVAKNHFGIKAGKSWKGERVSLMTWEVVNGKRIDIPAEFRCYKNATSSFKDRVRFLLKNDRYRKGGVFEATTPDLQAKLLQAAGYATDPAYSVKLISLMRRHKLYALDTGVGSPSFKQDALNH